MALTQEQVDAWFAANPNATADEVAAAVQSVGGLDANEGLAGMIANRYSIAEPEVTNYYNAFTTPVDTPDNAPDDTPTPPASVPTFTDAIVNPPTTQDDFLNTISTPVTPPADNITNSGLTRQAGQMVIEGDDIETQIAQLPTEYASWGGNTPGYTELIRKSDGAVLDRRKLGTLTNEALLKIGLSFVPGAAPFLAAYNALDAARKGDIVGAVIGGTGLVPGMENLNTALKVGKAVDDKNIFGAITTLAGNADVQKLTGLGDVNVGGFTAKDATAAVNLAKAAGDGNTAGVLTSLGTLTGSSDTVLAGKALTLYNRIQNGDLSALTDAVSLTNTLTGGTGKSTTGSTTPEITTLSDEDLAELNAGELNAYKTGGIDGLSNFRKDMKLLTSLTTSGRTGDDTGGGDLTTTGTETIAGTDTSGNVTLPGGVTLASTGDGVFRTEVGGTPTYADSKNASSVTVPFGYSLLSSSEADNKPEGAYYDITANAWFKPDTTVTNLTGGTTIASDADLFNTSIGDLDKLDDTRTGDDYADFLRSIGITSTTQLKDSGLSNQDILDMINASDDTVTVTGKTTTTTPAVTGTDTVTGTTTSTPTGTDKVDTVTVVGDRPCAPGFHKNDIGLCVSDDDKPPLECTEGFEPNEAGTECIPVVTIVDKKCDPGYVYDEDLKKCVLIDTVTVVGDKPCAAGFHKNELGLCVSDDDKPPLECPDGMVRDLETGECVLPPTTGLNCTEGFVPNEAGTECIAVVNVEECKDGKVRDPKTGLCVLPDGDKPCDAGFHKNEIGLCVPDDDEECKPGFERVDGECVPVCKEGYIRNLATGVCEKAEKDCPPGQVKNAEGKCVPVTKVTPPPVVKPPVKKVEVPTFTPGTSSYFSEDKTDPIYAEGMDEFDLFATLEELLADKPDKTDKKKDTKKSKDKTKMATGGHLDDLLAEQMTVDDLLNLLR